MKSDFLIAITQLSAEKNLPKEVVFEAVEAALVSAYKKDSVMVHQNISVKIHPDTGEVKVFAKKNVVEEPGDSYTEISLTDARKLKSEIQLGETIELEATPKNAGRIAAQTAKQVVLQRLREAEREAVFEEYGDKEGSIISGVVQRIEPKQIIIDLGKTEALFPASEQVPTERYRKGQRLKLYLLEVYRTNRGPQLIVSRTHRNLLHCLFELEVPELHSGTVEIKAIAREPGYRSKVAVVARQEGVDAIGCCVGLRGIRIQNVVNELSGERIDIVQWHPEPSQFVANALSPAQVLTATINEEEKTATVIVPDRQLSLAIGREGQNARLAAKLTGYRVDIKSESVAETEAEEKAKVEAEAVATEKPTLAEVEPAVLSIPTPEVAPSLEVAGVSSDVPEELVEVPAQVSEQPVSPAEEIPAMLEPPSVRFAEDIVIPDAGKPDTRARKGKKKRAPVSRKEETEIKPKKRRRSRIPRPLELEEEEEEDEYQGN